MGTRVVDLAAATLSRNGKPIPPGLVINLARLFHGILVAAVGFTVYLLYVTPINVEYSWRYSITVALAGLLTVLIHQWTGGYTEGRVFDRRMRVRRLLAAWLIAFAVLLAIAFVLKETSFYSRAWAISWFAATGVGLAVGQTLFSRWISRLAIDGRFANRTVIVGAGEQGQRLAQHLRENGDPMVAILGFIDDRANRVPRHTEGLELLGDVGHLMQLIRRGQVDQVFIALPWSARERVLTLMRRLAMSPVQIRLSPDLVGFEMTDRNFTLVARLPMLHAFDRPISGWSFVLKSVEDKTLASLAVLFCAPLMLLIAAAIKLDSKGPVLFKQKRYGFNNNLIEVWKFRSMRDETTNQNWEVQTIKNDPRVTRVGEFLRRSSLDELPQLFNVLFGDMSIVGPRPHAVATKAEGQPFEEVIDHYAARHKVKPGMTGWAQVNGWRGETDTVEKIRKRVEHDLYYIDNWSIWFDSAIIFRTIALLFDDKNAY